MLAHCDLMAVEAVKGLWKKGEYILLVLHFDIKYFPTLFHLLQVRSNKASTFTLNPGGNLVED